MPFPARREEFANPNAVKVVTALDGRALYFSRATIPFDRDKTGFAGYRKHLGIYAYRKAALERFAALPPSPLEMLERLEQLRLLENGIALYVADAPRDTIGVDTEEDLVRAEAVLIADSSPRRELQPGRSLPRREIRIARKNRSSAPGTPMSDDGFHEQQTLNSLAKPAPAGNRSRRPPGSSLLPAILAPGSSTRSTTTGVFCRPSCASRRPLRANVRFFRTAAEAQAAGFRPCKRCKPERCASSPLDKIRAHIESPSRPAGAAGGAGARGGVESLHRAAALQARDGRQSAGISARARGPAAAQRAQKRRHCDRRNL